MIWRENSEKSKKEIFPGNEDDSSWVSWPNIFLGHEQPGIVASYPSLHGQMGT